MRIGSLFSGVGALDIAVAQVFNGTVAWQSEISPGARRVLKRHSMIPNLGDVTKIDWRQLDPVDVLCGGFPCQDVSVAGFRRGVSEGTRSGLWSKFAEAVDALRPSYVVIENVRGLLTADADGIPAIDRILGDLTGFGYDVQWVLLPASGVGAPHLRERVFILAIREDTERISCVPVDRFRPDGMTLLHTPAARDGYGLPPHPKYTSLVTDVWDLVGRKLPEGWEPSTTHRTGTPWGDYEPAVRRWASVIGRPAPSPTEPNRNGLPRLAATFSEWLLGWPKGWVTRIVGLNRIEMFTLIGNGVVIQQATSALSELMTKGCVTQWV